MNHFDLPFHDKQSLDCPFHIIFRYRWTQKKKKKIFFDAKLASQYDNNKNNNNNENTYVCASIDFIGGWLVGKFMALRDLVDLGKTYATRAEKRKKERQYYLFQ